ncbi:hypothetical protein BU26DRAFT_515893 [Trematosphaeria pertusa]|uniref:Condensation domain-containing protein n=1 Tax=Trematosphaeria pertusa TaxID=390896 RepID=A0A6A6ITR3_9PLEO|nr:uncharacterized protein BU26DRAFT_515893 [Trematosphaeria pertusa]KAF2253558.1 hypothetical protein BU26DRAFT_515893 [Trematosphaeria pertusa]
MAPQKEKEHEQEHWLSRYASNYHAWRTEQPLRGGKKVFTRPLGLVEYSFDTDGSDYGGRADMNALFTLEIAHCLPSNEAFRRRIALAWASLRLQHVMLMSRVREDEKSGTKRFVVDVPRSAEEAVEQAMRGIVWVEDFVDGEVDGVELHRHCLNVGRVIEPETCLSKLHVLPLVELPGGRTFELRFLIVMAHQISDGLAAYNWFSHFVRILNMSAREIEREIEWFREEGRMRARLPPAQEDLYPRIAGNKARQRWFWAIMRVLRHVRKTLPPTFTNPLRRSERLPQAPALRPTFSKLFDYSVASKPPMNSGHCSVALSKAASTRLIALCRSINASIGAGCFALAGLSMMELHESLHPNIPLPQRHAFAASFPLNPRAFFGFNTPADSCMLAFSDGIVMPFLTSSLPVEGRFKLIARQANRGLRAYQKRLKGRETSGGLLDPHSPGRLLANGYLFQLERVESKLPPSRRTGINPQGALPAKTFMAGATCGVSSVGSTAAFFKPGMYDLGQVGRGEGTKDFSADFRGLKMGVRARENEFLVGSSTDADGIVGFGVSYDANAISEQAAEMWAEKIRSLLEVEDRPKL